MLLTRPPLTRRSVRLACLKHAASVYPEPGSNSPLEPGNSITRVRITVKKRVYPFFLPLFSCQSAARLTRRACLFGASTRLASPDSFSQSTERPALEFRYVSGNGAIALHHLGAFRPCQSRTDWIHSHRQRSAVWPTPLFVLSLMSITATVRVKARGGEFAGRQIRKGFQC